MIKIFGYVDDFINWQLSLDWKFQLLLGMTEFCIIGFQLIKFLPRTKTPL